MAKRKSNNPYKYFDSKRNRWVLYRDARGRTVSKDYTGRLYKAINGKLFSVGMAREGKTHLPKHGKRTEENKKYQESRFKEPVEHVPITGQPTEQVNVSDLNLPRIDFSKTLPKTIEIEFTGAVDKYGNAIGVPVDPNKYEYSEEVELRTGYDNGYQVYFHQLFEKANKKGEELKEKTENMINVHFSYNLKWLSKKQIDKRVEAAKKVLDPNFENLLIEKYKKDFIDNFSNHLDPVDLFDLTYTVDSIPSEILFKALKVSRLDYLAYALDSVIDREGYEMIMDKVRFIVKEIKTLSQKKSAKAEK